MSASKNRTLWKKQIAELDRTARRKKRMLLHLVDIFASHMVDNEALNHVTTHMLPPNTASVLQPVDGGIESSFTAAFFQLLVNHVLSFVHNLVLADRKNDFKLTEAVTIYN